MTCTVTGCENQARRDRKTGLCWRCTKQKTRKGSPQGPLRTYGQWETLLAAVKAWWDLDEDRAFDRRAKGGRSRAEERISKAALRYAEAVRRKKLSTPRQCPPPPKES